MTDKVQTPIFRADFVRLLTPNVSQKQNAKTGKVEEVQCYEITMIFEPKYEDPAEQERFNRVKKLVDDAIIEKYGKIPPGVIFKKPLRKGVQKTEENSLGYDLVRYPQYAGKIVAGARSYGAFAPDVVSTRKDAEGKRIRITDPKELYSGIYGRATITAYISSNPQYSKTISFGLHSFMKVRDGEPLGVARGNADDEFDGFDEDNDDNADLLDETDIPF